MGANVMSHLSSSKAFCLSSVHPHVEDPYYNGMVLLLGLAAKYEDVVHVNNYNSLAYEFSEDVVHHCLECHQAVSEAEAHD